MVNTLIANKSYYDYTKDELIKKIILTEKNLHKLETVVEHLADGVYITDKDTNTICVNLAYERISGTPRKEFLGKTIYQVVDEGLIDSSGTIEAIKLKRAISMQQTLNNGRVALITSTPIFGKDQSIEYIVTIVRDITELINLRNEIIEKENEISKLKEKNNSEYGIVYKSKKTELLIEKIKKVAKYDTTIFITGETGVGKGLFAEYIHNNSNRSEENFVQLNCASIPSTLIESELFGYEKGAFTGASNKGKKGIFEQANRGTLFLDEIAELPLEMQPKLLSVLQDGKIRRIGSEKETDVNVRIIAATNRDIKQMVKEKKFREDLYYRLNVIPIKILPLRERREDIISLVNYFINKLENKYENRIYIDKDVLNIFYKYDWPGNVRELENLMERLFVMCAGNRVTISDIPDYMQNTSLAYKDIDVMPIDKATSIIESHLIKKAYEEAGTVKDAAKLLDIHPSTFVRKRQKYEKEGYIVW